MPSDMRPVGPDQELQRTVEQLRRELAETREQQAATAEILAAISGSPTNPHGVFAKISASAARLCDADNGAILQVAGNELRLIGNHGPLAIAGPIGQVALPLTRGFVMGRAILERRTIHVADLQTEVHDYPEGSGLARRLGYHTIVAVPLIHVREAIGALLIRRGEMRPFTDRQIELLKIFADQAVIAIENTRLFAEVQARTRELGEAVEQQTVTAEVLGIISRSPGELEHVFEVIVRNATGLCQSKFGAMYLREKDSFRTVALHGAPAAYVRARMQEPVFSPGPGTALGRAAKTGEVIHVADITAESAYAARDPLRVANVELGGVRTMLVVPMLKENELIGVLSIYRQEIRPFTDKQIQLVNDFAKQGVIAIENSRLFEELQARTRELAKTVEDLETASQHKSQFVANMSHELRTPLAAILGYAELMQEGFYEPQGPKSLDALTRICSNGKHLLGLINTVLDIAKIESGQFTLNMTEYAIESVVETVRSATESLAQNKKLAFKTEVAKSLPIGVGDEQRLTQVLLNLVGNAIKFTDKGEVRVAANTINGHFAVSVTDTGPGIPQEHQERIFEHFHQVDSSLTKAKGGTGLGLAIAKQIVEMHGGRIWVESTVGKGSTFRMELPTRAELHKVAP
jgi:signal transduction histidine kinase